MSKAKQKGTAAETAVVRYLQANGFPAAERRALAGALDKGDIAGVVGVCVEVKAEEDHPARPDAWFEETRTESSNAGVSFRLLVVKVKYKPVERWDAWMPVCQFGESSSRFDPERNWTWVRMDLRLAVQLLQPGP